MENKNEAEIEVIFRKMRIENGKVVEKVWNSNLMEFREHYPEYAEDLVRSGCAGDAIGQNLYFQANIVNI